MPAYSSTSQGLDAASHKLQVGTILELFEIDSTMLVSIKGQPGNIIRFIDSARTDGQNFLFRGNVYIPWPITSDGWEWSSDKSPRPTITVADGQGTIYAQTRDFRGLVNARVRRILTTAELAASGQGSIAEVFQIGRTTSANGTQATFELQSSLELNNKKFPARVMMRDAATPEESFPALGRNRYRY